MGRWICEHSRASPTKYTTMLQKKLLVPVDFSTCSINAVRYAVTLAKKMKGQVLLMHSLNVPVTHGEIGAAAIVNELSQGIEEDVNDSFAELIDKIPMIKEVPYDTVIKSSFITDAVLSASKSNDIDMIVMGTKGAHGLEEMVMGSNTYSVIRDINIPVIAVPGNAEFKSVQRIVFASDYKKTAPESLEPLLDLARTFGAEVHVLHISPGQDITAEEMEEAKKFDRYLKNIRHHYHFTKNDNLEESIEKYVEENNINMISLMPRKHNIFELIFGKSQSRKIILHTELPLLALPH